LHQYREVPMTAPAFMD